MSHRTEEPRTRPELSPAKEALLRQRVAAARERGGARALPRRTDDGPAPLSFAQERLWFLERLEPGRPLYNLFWGVRLHGPLDAAALDGALAALVRRHSSLRTALPAHGGTPVQVVQPAEGWACEHVDLSALPAAAREEALAARARALAEHPFDLERGPLFRAQLLRLDEGEHAMLLCMHHVVSDGWSMGVIRRELAALYRAALGGEAASLPEAQVSYADFAAWQRERLRGAALESELAYWRERLSEAPELLELPADHPRPPVQDFEGRRERVEIPAPLAAGLRELARREGSTLYMVLLSAWQAVLGHYAGTDDVVLGTPVAGRTRPELEGVVGFFANTLALRTDLSGDPSFGELLGRVRETMLGAYDHQELPFDKLVEALRPGRSLGHHPVFQVMLSMQEAGASAPALEGLRESPLMVESRTARFDLALALTDGGEALHGGILYASALFEPDTIRRLSRHWVALLGAAAGAPGRPLSRLLWECLPGRDALVARGIGPDAPPAGCCLHRAFEAHARRTPHALALVAGEARFSYGELDRRAERVAHALRARGVVPDTRVGLLAERSPDAIAGMLGVLKAGGAYVPLDPEYPAERLAYMLRDSAAAVLLATESARGAVPSPGVPVVSLERAAGEAPARPGPAPDPLTTAEHLAYVMYTSGSTGRPKGVMIPHGAAAARIAASVELFGVDRDSRVVQAGSFSFDVSVLEVFVALSAGASLHLAPRETVLSAERFGELLRRERITTWAAVPSLLEVVDAESVPDLETLSTGGDRCPPEVAARWAAAHRLLNVYAPTEATIYATAHACRAEPAGPPIGLPIAGARVFVLDRRMHLAPDGAAGEMYIGGTGVARGYLGRPALTAQRFVPDAVSGEPGARLYRSGDRGRWNRSGELEFLGRVDQQVKVRGMRVEPGEVEAALRRHPEVADAAVDARADAPGGRGLVGYVVPAGATPPAAGLREFLERRLPAYMVPAAFVVLDALPRTPTGKVDRRALPAPSPDAGPDADYAPPRTATEEIIAGIWSAVLEREPIGAHDHFFALGGHSLLIIRVLASVRSSLGVELPVRALFEAPTVAALAARVEAARGGAASPPPCPRAGEGRTPLSFAQERLWFLEQLAPGRPTYNVPAAFRLRGRLDETALDRALEEVVRRHESLRTTFPSSDGRPVQAVQPAEWWDSARADLSRVEPSRKEEALLARVRAEAERPFDLERGPLFRAVLATLGRNEHALLLCVHHAVADGWSMGVLFRELSALYSAFAEDRPSPLPPLPVQYADYAAWQRERLSGAALEAELAWWRDTMADAPEVLEIPTDHPRPAMQGELGAIERIELPPGLASRLRALARDEGATLHMVLLAAFQLLLARYSGRPDVVVGTPVAGRTHREIEGLVGFFANTLPLRTRLEGDPTFAELLARVRAAALGAYEHQEIPFERLVDGLGVERSLAHNPLVQAVLLVQQGEPAGLRLAGVEAEPLTAGESFAPKFDLLLVVSEHAGGLAAGMQYRPDLFDAPTIRRMLEHFRVLLEGAAAHPERRVSRLPLLAPGEANRLLVEWNETPAAAAGPCLHEFFERQAEATPSSVALEAEGVTLTYAELDARADALAHALRGRGVGPEVRVGICLERGPELLVALLAVLKAGGAYVPLDPAYPAGRVAFMLEDSGARVAVTREALLPRLAGSPADPLCVDRDRDRIRRSPAGRPARAARPENLAYVIYTSGSTGRPKGVMIQHASAAALLGWAGRAFSGAERARVLGSTSVCFDLSVFELFLPLSTGGCVVLCEDALALARPGAETGITLLNTVPSAATELARLGALPPTLRTVCLAGEPLPAPLVEALYEAGVERVWNLYAPSETTTYSTGAVIPPGRPRPPHIGTPLDGEQVYVADSKGEPLPAGVPGELLLGGAGVARGYLGRPGLTAERFVPDPFSGRAGARLYRTGDRARWRPDGELEFLGRLDHQVKIRGFRVEPGEVEAVLRRHPAVEGAVVVVREDGAARRLVGYAATGDAADAPTPAALRTHLRASLPEHMVPAVMVVLPRLPQTPNGKVDRAALPAPEPSGGAAEHVAPGSAVEEALCAIWSELLGVPRVGVHDEFFELGGDSILAIQVVARAAQAGIRISPRDLFRFHTVAGLAEAAGRAGRELPDQGPVTGLVPLTPIQHWFVRQSLPEPGHFNQSMLLRPRSSLDPETVRGALAHLLAHHDALRLRCTREGGEWRQHHAAPGGEPPFEHVDLSGAAEPSRALAEHAAARQGGLDLSAGPIVRGVLYDLGADGQRLLLVVHHLAVDGVSWRILLDDLETACRALQRGEPVRLPPKTTSFREWAERLTGIARDEDLRAELEHWAGTGAAAGPLPMDLGGDNPEGSARTLRTVLPTDETQALLQEAPRALRAGIDEVLLAALARTLLRWTRGAAVRIDLEGHGREALFEGVDLSRTVGWFTSLYPVRLEAPPRPGAAAALRSVREQLRRVPRRGIGFGLLRYLGDEDAVERLAALPGAEVSFNYLGQFDGSFTGEGLFSLAAGDRGPERHPDAPRTHLLDVTAVVSGGALRVSWTYGAGVHRPETVQRLADACLEALREIAGSARAAGEPACAPADFPDVDLSEGELDEILAELSE